MLMAADLSLQALANDEPYAVIVGVLDDGLEEGVIAYHGRGPFLSRGVTPPPRKQARKPVRRRGRQCRPTRPLAYGSRRTAAAPSSAPKAGRASTQCEPPLGGGGRSASG